MRASWAFVIAALALACAPTPVTPTRAETSIALSASTTVRQLTSDTWLITIHGPDTASANALLVTSTESSALIDSGSSAAEAARVITWARDSLARPISAALLTSADEDRVGGVAALTDAGIPVYATGRTVELCATRGAPIVTEPLDATSIPGVTWMFVRIDPFPEALVAYHAATHVLFGGLFVDAADATAPSRNDPDRLGSRAAFDLVAASYPDAVVVVPGRGEAGDLSLVARSRMLLAECHDDAECVVTAEDLDGCHCCPCIDARAMARATVESLHAQPRCEPICASDVQCPACPSADAIAHMPVHCDRGECALVR
jgi:metallo-beta-lactamase class B